jgi:ketosteroid isomerase-like protein
MNLEEKRAAAVKFTLSIGHDPGFDESMITDDFLYWAHGVGTIDKDTFRNLIQTLRPVIPGPPTYKITGTTAEGDRVAIECDGATPLSDGTVYTNQYHFVVVFRGDKICLFKEYYDSKRAADSVGPILAKIPRGADGHA